MNDGSLPEDGLAAQRRAEVARLVKARMAELRLPAYALAELAGLSVTTLRAVTRAAGRRGPAGRGAHDYGHRAAGRYAGLTDGVHRRMASGSRRSVRTMLVVPGAGAGAGAGQQRVGVDVHDRAVVHPRTRRGCQVRPVRRFRARSRRRDAGAVPAAFAMRSYRDTTPSTWPAIAITGTALMSLACSSATRSRYGMVSPAVTTGAVMTCSTSVRFTAGVPPRGPRSRAVSRRPSGVPAARRVPAIAARAAGRRSRPGARR